MSVYSGVFSEHATKLVEVSELAVSMSDDQAGVRQVRHAAQQLETLVTQVINAAMILTLRHESEAAINNMETFRQSWEEVVVLLTRAVDNIVTVDDFLAVSENHVLEDVKRCCLAMKQSDLQTLASVSASLQGRTQRISEVVAAEMESFEAGVYTETVMEAVNTLMTLHVPNFVAQVDLVVENYLHVPQTEVDENEFLDSSRQLYEGVRDIRRAVLIGIVVNEIQTDTEDSSDDDEEYVVVVEDDVVDEYPDLDGIDSAADAMRHLPESERSQIAEQVEQFLTEQQKFDQEVSR